MTDIEQRLEAIFEKGLVAGIGEGKPGSLCIESAIVFARGLPHSDKPPCVHEVDQSFWIAINDGPWLSKYSRASALLPAALAQLGTVNKDRKAWLAAVTLGIVRTIAPRVLQAAANAGVEDRFRLELLSAASGCKSATRDNLGNVVWEVLTAVDSSRGASHGAETATFLRRARSLAQALQGGILNPFRSRRASFMGRAAAVGSETELRQAVEIALTAYAEHP